ncbi:Gmad2 immunoglobulin-like domain-containing protein [Phytohabitans sp. LJ34]|uniref:Gmad2 immunoglobulin-like domain-containing protein n=1 Tax=Phytohabitans sp. LJ34 TaxID=3452217 RepID=UPI003F897F1A
MRDRHEEVLRRVMEAEAAKVEVSPDALTTIRARTVRRARWLPFGAIAFTAATATAATLVVVALAARPTPHDAAPDPGAVTAPATTQPPATSAPPTSAPAVPPPSKSSPSSGTSTESLAIYYVADDGGKPRLYREFHRLPADGSPAGKVRAAVTGMLAQESAEDPDYTSAWPAGTDVSDASVAGGVVTVHLSAAPPDDLAGQQLVWTVAAAVGGDPQVRVLVGGREVASLRKKPALDTLGALWLIEPQQGATVAKTFEVHAAGAVFEATAQLTVRQGRTVVTEKTITLSAGAPARGEARITLTLAPGTYVLELYAHSAEDGSVQHLDDHTVTVR